MPSHDRRRSRQGDLAHHRLGQPAHDVELFFDRRALIGRRRRATSPQCHPGTPPGRHQLEREQPAKPRLGRFAMFFVDTAAVLRSQEHTTAIGPGSQPGAPTPRSASNEAPGAAKIGVFAPPLRFESPNVLLVQLNDLSQATEPAAVAIPSFDDRRNLERNGHARVLFARAFASMTPAIPGHPFSAASEGRAGQAPLIPFSPSRAARGSRYRPCAAGTTREPALVPVAVRTRGSDRRAGRRPRGRRSRQA